MSLNYRFCDCGERFSFEKKRGRPPVQCQTCKEKGVKRAPKPAQSLESQLEAAQAELAALRAKIPEQAADPFARALYQARVAFPSNMPVRILERLWRGVPIPSRTGKISEWKSDKYGPVAVILLRGGSECLARPEMLEKR